jgi:two-component system nitrogen regulation response regulator GlnG
MTDSNQAVATRDTSGQPATVQRGETRTMLPRVAVLEDERGNTLSADLPGVPPAPPMHAGAGTAALPSALSASSMVTPNGLLAQPAADSAAPHWLLGLEREARELLEAGSPEVWDTLIRRFEAQMIHTALEVTRGRRIEAAQRLGIGRNTITRKIQELGLDE